MIKNKRESLRLKRHRRILLRMRGTGEKPRLVIKRSLKNLHAQLVDDTQSKVLFYLSTLGKEIKQKVPNGGNIKAAQVLGDAFALQAKEKGFTRIIFDRAGYLYHGRVKVFAEALRKGGLEF